MDRGVYRTFVQGTSGLEESFSLEFAPGPHTIARVEALTNSCRATATNISFTIKAGQWAEVDVPVTWQDCSFELGLVAAADGHPRSLGQEEPGHFQANAAAAAGDEGGFVG